MPECYARRITDILNGVLFMSELTMAKPNQPVYFILMRDSDKAEKKIKTGIKTKTEQTSALKGSLWTIDSKEFQDISKKNLATLRSAECKDISLTCELQDITKLSVIEFYLLLALTTCKERSIFYFDNWHMGESTRLYKNWKEACNAGAEFPRVEIRDDRFGEVVTGTLKYVGDVPSRSGFWFGVEMDREFLSLKISNTDGSFENQVLFSCAPNRGLLVTANKIFPICAKNCSSPHGSDRSLQPGDSSKNFRASQSFRILDVETSPPPPPPPLVTNSVMRRTLEPEVAEISGVSHPEVALGDRVVWYDENNDEQLATVRWIGNLNEKLTIGVENDKPVGSGTGMYNNQQLFVTQPNYASLIPIDGLLKAEVVYGSRDFVPLPPNSRGDTFLKNVTGVPDWEAAVPWEAQFDQTTSVHKQLQPCLDSQSDIGTSRTPSSFQLLPSSASYDPIPSRRMRDVEVHHNPMSSSSENIKSLRCKNRKIDDNPLERGNPRVLDATDISVSTQGCRGSREEILSANNRTTEAEMDSTRATPGDEVLPQHRRNIVGSATSSRSGSMNQTSGKNSDTFVPVSLSSVDLQTDLDVGSMVEVDIPGYDVVQYGVIRWMGHLKEGNNAYVGVELEEENMACTDGTFKDVRLFACAPKKGFFTLMSRVRRDKRFAESSHFERRKDSAVFGSMECNELSGIYAHRRFETIKSLEDFLLAISRNRRGSSAHRELLGRNVGIQGHHNSCYLDATLFCMFAFSSAFDSVLHREKTPNDIQQYTDVQRVLRDGIVNPLRCQMFVRADKVLNLRNWLSECSSIQGLLDEEKDPDEFMISLLQETLCAEPLIKFSSGQSGFCYQLFVEQDEKIQLPTTQQLLSLSLFQSDIKFVEVPRCLILQMPRFGKDFQMYRQIIPSLVLDVTNMLQHDPQPCCFCGKLASSECRDCFVEFGKGCDRAYFCKTCIDMSHSPTMRLGHHPKDVEVYPESIKFYSQRNAPEIRSEILELFAIVCIKTSHYVCFTKCGSNPDAPWVFFDSMADRIGQQYGHNVPQLEICPELPNFLKDENRLEIMKCTDDKNLPERMRRLLCDGYVCLYQSPTLEPYR